MAAKATKGKNETFTTYMVVKAHDGLKKGEIKSLKAGDSYAEYCVSLGLWKRITDDKE
jgi:hypothetical protein